MTGITLRTATLDDLDTLRRWDEAPHVVAASGDDDGWDWQAELPRDEEWIEILIAELTEAGGVRAIGVVQIIDPLREESHYWGDVPENLRAIDIWIGEADCLGRGFGTEMMRQALARCCAPPEVTAVLIDPLQTNHRARRFYERIGFKFVENRRFGPDDCAVYRIDRQAWPARA